MTEKEEITEPEPKAVEKRKSPWNSLEAAKISVSLLTPALVALFGMQIQTALANRQEAWKAREHLSARRLAIYNEISTDLNRIYCFVEDVGDWKAETPPLVIKRKRHADAVMHSNRAIWSPAAFQAYIDYTKAAFDHYGPVGEDAKIKTSAIEKEYLPTWKGKEWNDRLTGEKDPQHRKKYERMINLISKDLILVSNDGTS